MTHATKKMRYDDDPLKRLTEWALSNGARMDKIRLIQDSENNRKAVSTQDIFPGEEICFIPSCLLLSESVANSSSIGTTIQSYIDSHPNDIFLSVGDSETWIKLLKLSAFMCYNMRESSGGIFQPYLTSLPKELDLPISWSSEFQQICFESTNMGPLLENRTKLLLQLYELYQRALEHAKNTKAEGYQDICDIKIDFEQLKWAHGCILSRVFPRAQQKVADNVSSSNREWIDISEFCLFPVLDMLNHKRGFKIEWRMSDTGVSFVSQEIIRNGEEVYNNYGPKGNENLLFHYGFVLKENPEEYFRVQLALSSQDPLHSRKLRVLERVYKGTSIPWKQLIFKSDLEDKAGDFCVKLPKNLLTIAGITVSNEFELRELETTALSFDASGILICSKRAQLASYQTLLSLFLSKLSSIRKNLHAISNVGQLNSHHRSLATTYLMDQEAILTQTIQSLECMFENALSSSSVIVSIPEMEEEDNILLSIEGLDIELLLTLALVKKLTNAGLPNTEQSNDVSKALMDKWERRNELKALISDEDVLEGFKDDYQSVVRSLIDQGVLEEEIYGDEGVFRWASYMVWFHLLDDPVPSVIL